MRGLVDGGEVEGRWDGKRVDEVNAGRRKSKGGGWWDGRWCLSWRRVVRFRVVVGNGGVGVEARLMAWEASRRHLCVGILVDGQLKSRGKNSLPST